MSFIFLLIILVKGNDIKDIGCKPDPIVCLRKLVEKEKQDTL